MLTGTRLSRLLTYDPDTGLFRWRGGQKRTVAGAVAGCLDKDGYIIICMDGKNYRAHRLAWLWMKGVWPTMDIDHRDTDKANNRFENLREATKPQNAHNKPKRGYYFDRRRNVFVAQIFLGGKHYHLGQFATSEEAAAAYNAKAAEFHGEFARMAA